MVEVGDSVLVETKNEIVPVVVEHIKIYKEQGFFSKLLLYYNIHPQITPDLIRGEFTFTYK